MLYKDLPKSLILGLFQLKSKGCELTRKKRGMKVLQEA